MVQGGLNRHHRVFRSWGSSATTNQRMGQKQPPKTLHAADSSTEFKASVRALSHKGHGVVTHPDGRVFFVKGTWPGEEGTFRAGAQAKSYENAELISLAVSAPERVTPACVHIDTCGGCPWMMVTAEAQVKAKEQRVTFLLDKNGIHVNERRPLLSSPEFFGYRNRAQFKTDGERLGYVSEGTNDLAPIEDCLILNPSMREMLQGLRSQLPKKEWRPVGRFPWSFLDVDDQQKLADVVPNQRRPFRQGNSAQNQNMKNWIVETLKDVPRDYPVVEAFCGSGNFTEALAAVGFKHILAAEVRGSAIEELTAKNLPGVQIMEINMNDKKVWPQIAQKQPKARVLLVDPPREGLEERMGIFKTMPQLEKIIYISCEPTTWARDMKDFQLNGWKVAHLTPLDMFPHTPHVELLTLLTR